MRVDIAVLPKPKTPPRLVELNSRGPAVPDLTDRNPTNELAGNPRMNGVRPWKKRGTR
jgi:hypothetical protein